MLTAHALQVIRAPPTVEDTVSNEHMISVGIQPLEIRKDSA